MSNAGNVPVIISGYFQEPVTAQLGSVDLLSVTLASATTLHAVVPVESLSEGVYDLAVETDGHLLSLADAFIVTAPVQQTQFRAMVYLACDNNLADECEGLFNKLELAMLSNPDLRLVAFWDGNVENDSAYYLVQPDDDPETWAQYTDGINRIPLGEVDSANPNTLVSFAAWAASQYPAHYSLLSLVGHGDGWAPDLYPGQILGIGYEWGVGGMLWDEGDQNVMSTAALAQALQWISSANQIDVIYLDACLMSSVEVMAELAPYAQYIVAHENIAWATYPYDQYLSNVDGSTTPSQLAQHIAQVNYDSWPAEGHPGQVSVVNTNQIGPVLAHLDTLALELLATLATLPEARPTIQEVVSNSTHLDENYNWLRDAEDSALDLSDFAEQLISQPDIPASVKSAAQGLIEALDNNTIIVNHSQNGTPWPGEQYWDLSTLHGLSLYFPLSDEWKRAYYGPEALPRFARSTAWDDFIQSWYAEQVAPEPPTESCDNCLKAPMQLDPSLEEPDSYLLHFPLVQR